MAITPIINFPTTSAGFSTNMESLTLRGWADSTTKSILVNNSTTGVTYSSGASSWSFVTLLNKGENVFSVSALDSADLVSGSDTVTVSYFTNTDLNLIVTPPTGINLERSRNSVKISVIENLQPEIIGYNFYGSEYLGGGTTGFTLLNKELVTQYDSFKEENIVLSQTVDTSGDVRTTYTIEKINRNYYYSFTHDRVNQPLGTKPLSEANHYVATAVAFDPASQTQVESIYSAELGASPLLIDTAIKDLSLRTTTDVQETYIDGILKKDETIDVKPGTVTRDIHINPPSDEFARLYIIQDFMHRSQSFLTLLDFDDPNNTGTSVSVFDAPDTKGRLKEALLLPDSRADEVQDLIDDAFTKLAGNVNVKRKAAQKAAGQALFYTRRTPTRDVVINSGAVIETVSDETTSAVQFSVLTDFTLPVANLEDYYNPLTDRYEVTLDIEALSEGSAGNVDAGKIQIPVSGVDAVFGVVNNNPTEFGQDIESNRSLAERAMLAFVSVDAGTEAGYLATTLGTPNVQRCKIISAGETLMQRDLDPLRLVHTFGKVDIYIQGSLQTSYSENFGFTYNTVKNENALIQSVSFFQFTCLNPLVTTVKPIFDVIQVRNVSRSAIYDITGFTISGNGNVIDLDESLPTNQVIGLAPTDVIQISYRYRDSDPYVFLNQPVDSIVSISGENSGTLTSANYVLQKLEDPLKFGNSTSAQDQMSLIYANGVPNGSIVTVFDESVSLFGENVSEISRFGVDPDTILVTDITNTITYVRDVDYTVIPGDMRTKTSLKRTTSSSIPSGSSVFVDYQAGENFTVTYNVNTLLTSVKNRIDTMRHLCADVVVKGAIKTYIDFDLKVVLESGADQTTVDRKIRTSIANLLTEKQIGQSVYQSDVIHAIEGINGVDYVQVPFTKMVKANGGLVVREVYSGSWVPFQTINVTCYKSNVKLNWETTENGGPDTAFRGVFQNDIELFLVDSVSAVAEGAGRAHISADGYLYVSQNSGNIADAQITTTYLVDNASGSRDINFCDIEYGAVGTLIITYDFSKQFSGF